MEQFVVISGLQSKPELNGEHANVIKFVAQKQRYHVKVMFKGKWINILLKKKNLIFVNNIHEMINAKNTVLAQIPWLLKAIKPAAMKQNHFFNDDDEKDDNKLQKSDIVLIHNLKNKKEYNLIFAEIIQVQPDTNRFIITFEFNEKRQTKSLKASNLKLILPSKYRTNTTKQCVTCQAMISSSQLITCPGCVSINYCSIQCRNYHFFSKNHIGKRCWIYRCNLLHTTLNYKYILDQYVYGEDLYHEIRNEETECFSKSSYHNNTNINTKINCWEDWMKHFGFKYECTPFHSYPMTLYHIIKVYFLKIYKNKNVININLVGCKDDEFEGIWELELLPNINDPLAKALLELNQLPSDMDEIFEDSWKWRWNLMGRLLMPLKLNIVCYGDELNEYCTDFTTKNLNVSFRKQLYLPNNMQNDNYDDPDLVIGLYAGIHEHYNTWKPMIEYCVDNKIPMMFTEGSMAEYELQIRERLVALNVENITVGFNPFRDIRLHVNPNPVTRCIFSINSFIYGIVNYD